MKDINNDSKCTLDSYTTLESLKTLETYKTKKVDLNKTTESYKTIWDDEEHDGENNSDTPTPDHEKHDDKSSPSSPRKRSHFPTPLKVLGTTCCVDECNKQLSVNDIQTYQLLKTDKMKANN